MRQQEYLINSETEINKLTFNTQWFTPNHLQKRVV